MGGNLAWTIRLEDGTEYRMDRWTNSMPGLILNPDFLSGQQAGIDNALQPWLEMKSDWEKNQHTEKFDLHMTPSYAPYPYGLAPSEYGLVITDFVSKTILSLQEYTDLGSLNAMRQWHGPGSDEVFPGKAAQLDALHRVGRISCYEMISRRKTLAEPMQEIGATVEPHPRDADAVFIRVPGDVDLEEFTALCDRIRDDVPEHPRAASLKALRDEIDQLSLDDPERQTAEEALRIMHSTHKASHRPFLFVSAKLDLSPFTLEEFEDSAEGYEALRERVLELGFSLSAEEEAQWAERIQWERENATRG